MADLDAFLALVTTPEELEREHQLRTQFPKGSKVRFNIGGPVMVVRGYSLSEVRCQWFTGTTLREGTFAPESLDRVKDESEL